MICKKYSFTELGDSGEDPIFDFEDEFESHAKQPIVPVLEQIDEVFSPISPFASTFTPSPSPKSPSSSSSSVSSTSTSSMSPSTLLQPDHSRHSLRFDFRSGAKLKDGIPICAPRSFKKGEQTFKSSMSTTHYATHVPTRATVIRKDVFVSDLQEFQIQNLIAEKTGYAPQIYCVEYYVKDHSCYKEDQPPPKQQSSIWEKPDLRLVPKPISVYMEYCCGGDMLKIMSEWDQETSYYHDTIRNWMLQAYNAIDAVHSQGKLHLDIKVENFVFNCRGDLQLIDFGFAETKEGMILDKNKGTIPYAAPEVHYYRPIGFETDNYAFGVLLAVVFERNNEFSSIGGLEFERTPKDVQSLIAQLTGSRAGRITAWKGLPEHPFFKVQ